MQAIADLALRSPLPLTNKPSSQSLALQTFYKRDKI